MNKVRYIKFSPDEYISGVGAVLDAEHQGVYWMICSMIYSNGGDIPNDPKHIGRLVCLGSAKARRIIDHLIFTGKITENQSFLSQKRSVTELKHARNRTESATKNGNVPKKIKHLNGADAYELAQLTTNHKPITINQEQKKSPKGSRISKEWSIKDQHKAYAIDKGFMNGQIQELGESFKDYWLADSTPRGTKKDWDAAFRMWVRNAVKFRGGDNDEIGERIR